ncbi:MAG: hypothetical protein B7X06_00770 [Verrucomicrobia bacterium 21-51-4]|nr:MAG: hypothetical protein B7X06_00770 [Verrucomicrobia bacterium 21-51-4]HQU08678.1 transcriptional repressor [Opitutales bacterium]
MLTRDQAISSHLKAPTVPSAQQEPSVDTLRDTFKNYLIHKGLRVTDSRMAIFEAAFIFTQHFTAEELLDAARKLDSTVSRATVYRTLPILIQSQAVREVDVGRDTKYYLTQVPGKNFQAQIICSNCEKIFEIEALFMDWYGKSVASKLNMGVETYRLQVTAQCNALRDSGACPHSK